MQRLVYGLMKLLMILWTAAVLYDIGQGLFADDELLKVINGELISEQSGQLVKKFWAGFWSSAAQTRAIIWGMPMTVFALIAVITHPGRS